MPFKKAEPRTFWSEKIIRLKRTFKSLLSIWEGCLRIMSAAYAAMQTEASRASTLRYDNAWSYPPDAAGLRDVFVEPVDGIASLSVRLYGRSWREYNTAFGFFRRNGRSDASARQCNRGSPNRKQPMRRWTTSGVDGMGTKSIAYCPSQYRIAGTAYCQPVL